MSRHYRIASTASRGPGGGLLGRAVLLVAASLAFGALGTVADPRWGAVVTVVLLAISAAVLLDWRHSEQTAFALTPGIVAVGEWRLVWSAVSRIAVYDLADAALLGVRLRSPAELPADVPPAQLDQSDPAHPVILVASAVDPARLDELVAVFRRIAPAADLVHHTGSAETTLVPASV